MNLGLNYHEDVNFGFIDRDKGELMAAAFDFYAHSGQGYTVELPEWIFVQDGVAYYPRKGTMNVQADFV